MNDIISTSKKEAWSFLNHFFLIFLVVLSFHPFLKISAQEEGKIVVKPKHEYKYNLGPQLLPTFIDQENNPDNPTPLILQTSCPNSNFSAGTWDNWTGCYGTFINPCLYPGIHTTGQHPTHKIIPGPGWLDHNTCDSLTNVFPGENFVARLGDTIYYSNNGNPRIPKAAELKYQVTVSSNSYLFIYRYAVVLQSGGHIPPASYQPDFQVMITNGSGTVLDSTCGYFYIAATVSGAPLPGWHLCNGITPPTPSTPIYWKNWTTIGMDLTSYLGQTIYVLFKVRPCSYDTHFGYAYISTYCSQLEIQTSLCEGQDSAVLTAPPGFSYYWTAITGNHNIDGDTTASITVPSQEGATYQCKLTAVNGCWVDVINTLHYTQIHTGYTETMFCAERPSSFVDTTWVSQNQVTAWRWFFGDPASGASDSSHLQNPTHSFTAPGNYNVTLMSYSTEGCSDTTVKPVVVDTLVNITNPLHRKQICSNQHTNIVMTTNVSNALYTWTATCISGVITGFSNNATPALSPIDQILVNNGIQPDSVTYIITPHKGTCAGDPFTFVVVVNPLPVPAIGGPVTACAGSTGNIYSTLPGMTNYLWNVSAGGTITSGGSITDNTATVTWNTPGPRTVSLNYTDANFCTAIAPTVYAVTVNTLPVPLISGAAGMCVNTSGIYTTAAGMTGYNWTVSAGGTITFGGGTNSITILWTANGLQTITLSYADGNGCTPATPSTFNVTINTLPIPSINGLTSVCTGSTTTYTSEIGMNNYSWIVSAGGMVTAGGGSTDAFVTVLWSTVGAQTVSVNYVNGTVCTAATPTVKDVTVHALPIPTISGTAVLCAGTSGVVYTAQPGMTNYIWTVSAGGTITSGGGPANNTVTVTWTTPGAKTVSVNFIDANGCTALAPTVYPVTVNPLPVPSVDGPAAVCLNSTGTYFTEPGMTNYLWSVSAGGTFISGTGTNSVNILWSTTGAKTITVNYNDANGCAAVAPSTYPVTVNILPVPALNGLTVICSGTFTTYTTDAGMTNYLWLVSAGGTITSGGGASDNSVTVTWNTPGIQTVSVNYSMGTGCTALIPSSVNVNVKPRPSVTNAANSTICSGVTTNIPLFASLPLTTFSWTATGSSGNVQGQSNSGGPVISQPLTNLGFNIETVDYAVTPSLNGCDGPIAHFIVTVDPVADAYFNPNGQTFCSGGTSSISILSHVANAIFSWTASGSSGDILGFGPGNIPSIAQILTNIGTAPGFVTYTISPSFNSCPGTPNQVVVTVNPLPGVTYTICNDVITTTAAQPFRLKGGLPLGGTYSGAGVNTGIFYPSIAGIGNHTTTYSYLNTWGCTANATQVISVINPAVFLCDNTMTDIRDGKQYPTVKIGTQCWMAENLDYGTFILSTQMQRDNCISEKYCFGDNLANCTSYGGLYQWDKLMQYDNTSAAQGFCPPGWHVPTENEWNTLFNFYISNGFAGSPLKYSGYSGFNAFLSGTRFDNINWNFSNFAVMFWSSTKEGNGKAWAHGMNSFNPSVSYYPSSRSNAFSVRCIGD